MISRYLVFVISILPTFVLGQEAGTKPKHHEEHYHLSVFGGYTTDYKGKIGYKLGFEYEGRLNDYVGLGGTFDFTGADYEIFAFSVGADFYPFKFPLIPGILVGAKNYESNWDPFARIIVLYEFPLGKMSVGPVVMYDFFPNYRDIMSYGVAVGYSLH